MPHNYLSTATEEVTKLCGDSKQVERGGPEHMKSTFLGGMREGQSWGLRRWLSKNGAALQACNQLETILTALQTLDESSEFCIALATKIRRLTSGTRDRLLEDIPKAYQEFSSAHPFLPFFHRLDAALKGLAEFDPEDDDVIMMDDDEIEEMKAKAKAKDAEKAAAAASIANNNSGASNGENKKRSRDEDTQQESTEKKRARADQGDDSDLKVLDGPPGGRQPQSGRESADTAAASVAVAARASTGSSPSPTLLLEQMGGEQAVLGSKDDWRCGFCVFKNPANSNVCLMCDQSRQDGGSGAPAAANQPKDELDQFWDQIINQNDGNSNNNNNNSGADNKGTGSGDEEDDEDDDESEASDLGQVGQVLAQTVERFQHSPNLGTPTVDFWDQNWSFCINLFATILREKEALWYLEPVNEEELEQVGRPPYRSIVKNPLSFKCIIRALKRSEKTKSDRDGMLRGTDLKFNVRHGRDLLQAIDVVFLNALAYNGKEWNDIRRDTLKLRRMFWDRIRVQAQDDPRQVPTRRGETSGFIVKS
jgi:hypothetical protein